MSELDHSLEYSKACCYIFHHLLAIPTREALPLCTRDLVISCHDVPSKDEPIVHNNQIELSMEFQIVSRIWENDLFLQLLPLLEQLL